jgi:CubicO group peptidase (beta-lactamase class C family)
MKKNSFQYFIIAILFLSSISCSNDNNTETYTYNLPEALNDGLEVSSLDSVEFDKELIEYMIDHVNNYKYIHSILIVRNDKLVLEEYFAGFRSNTLNNTYSVTKSFCSALVGIAIDKQYIKSVNDPIKTYLQEYNIDWSGKENIKIHHLLTMSSGFEWDEDTAPYGTPENSHTQMNQSPDQVKYVIQRPVEAKPGTEFRYNTGTVNVLGKIVANSIEMEFDTFATRYLFKPLEINRHKWYIYPSGIYHTGGNLEITSRDMVKFGLLYLNHGRWKGQQIISEEWINLSVQDYIRTNQSQVNYGYLWWKRPLLMLNGQRVEGYTAEGFGGQTIFVLPGYNMVVVFTSGIDWNEEELTYQPVEILEQFILPAIK